MKPLKAPFPYFGGKSTVAGAVWARFGDAPNYVEPFFGSGAVLLSRPHPPKTETVNDADGLLVNFWRALQADPGLVAYHADWPVSEIDLTARHLELRRARADVERMMVEPGYYDAKLAGWWVWGLCSWIGNGWCAKDWRGQPHLGDAGQGINRRLPHLGDAGQGINRRGTAIREYFHELAERLRDVRITCGNWSRIIGPSPTTKHGLTAVFLDPPYGADERQDNLYAKDGNIAGDVRAWAIEHGDDPLMRIALCGYDTEHEDSMPPDWSRLHWRTRGGYGNRGNGRGRANRSRETIWFSPHCLPATLFELCGVDVGA